jgi:hypothetical protein
MYDVEAARSPAKQILEYVNLRSWLGSKSGCCETGWTDGFHQARRLGFENMRAQAHYLEGGVKFLRREKGDGHGLLRNSS